MRSLLLPLMQGRALIDLSSCALHRSHHHAQHLSILMQTGGGSGAGSIAMGLGSLLAAGAAVLAL